MMRLAISQTMACAPYMRGRIFLAKMLDSGRSVNDSTPELALGWPPTDGAVWRASEGAFALARRLIDTVETTSGFAGWRSEGDRGKMPTQWPGDNGMSHVANST